MCVSNEVKYFIKHINVNWGREIMSIQSKNIIVQRSLCSS